MGNRLKLNRNWFWQIPKALCIGGSQNGRGRLWHLLHKLCLQRSFTFDSNLLNWHRQQNYRRFHSYIHLPSPQKWGTISLFICFMAYVDQVSRPRLEAVHRLCLSPSVSLHGWQFFVFAENWWAANIWRASGPLLHTDSPLWPAARVPSRSCTRKKI